VLFLEGESVAYYEPGFRRELVEVEGELGEGAEIDFLF